MEQEEEFDAHVADETLTRHGEEEEDQDADMVVDGGRNWTAVATEALVRSWRKVSLEGRAPDEKSAHVFQRIFAEYQGRVPNTKRTIKAVEDKSNSLGQAYRFISDFNAHRVPGSTGRGPWHSLTPNEKNSSVYSRRKENNVRVPDVDSNIFDIMNSFLGDKPDVRPISDRTPVNMTAPSQQQKTLPISEKETKKRDRMTELDDVLEKRQKVFLETLKEAKKKEQERRDKRHSELLGVFHELIEAYKSSNQS